MREATSHGPAYTPPAFPAGEISVDAVARYRRNVFGTVADVVKLRDWVDSPRAQGLDRGMALWALGRYDEAVPILESELGQHPALAVCLSEAYTAQSRFGEALKVLGPVDDHPDHAEARLAVSGAQGDADGLSEALEQHKSALSVADQKFYAGRLQEFRRDPEGAIALYDEALSLDEQHRSALFRLALNVDLRGEDEEARELYERALLCPPVNSACVINLGVLYEDLGNYRRAMQCYDLVVQADPANERARLYRRDAASSLTMYYDEDQERREGQHSRLLRTSITEFELSVRSANCLANMNVRTLGDLVAKSESELLSYHNFGETSLAEIKEILHHKGLRLNMSVDDLIAREADEAPQPQAIAEPADPNSPDPARRPVAELDLSVRSRRIVDLFGIRMIGDLAAKTEAELLSCPNFGQTSLNEVKRKLNDLGLSLRD